MSDYTLILLSDLFRAAHFVLNHHGINLMSDYI